MNSSFFLSVQQYNLTNLNKILIYTEASQLLAASVIQGEMYPSCLAVNFLLASSQKAGWVSSCVLTEILTFTLLYKLKIAAAVDFRISDDCSSAQQSACGLLSFLLRTLAGSNLKKFYVLTCLRSTKKKIIGLWMYERRRRKGRKGKKACSVMM